MSVIRVGMAVLALLFLPAAAQAQDCEAQCRTTCYGQGQSDYWKCDDDRRSCIAACRSGQNNTGPGPVVTRSFGAIAYSRSSGGYGYSFGHPSRRVAEGVALGHCRNDAKGAGDCGVLVWFWNACAALAVAPNGSYGGDHAPDRARAERSAVRTCASHGGVGCRVVRWVCSN